MRAINRRATLIALFSCALLWTSSTSKAFAAGKHPHPHYVFLLPPAYVGWVQIIFNDPDAPQLVTTGYAVTISVPENGIARTSTLRVHDDESTNEFYYQASPNTLLPISSQYVLPGVSQGGFGVMDTGGKGRGYSWFFFVGPPEVRERTPLADWDKVVEQWEKVHGNRRVSGNFPYPTPGRMTF